MSTTKYNLFNNIYTKKISNLGEHNIIEKIIELDIIEESQGRGIFRSSKTLDEYIDFTPLEQKSNGSQFISSRVIMKFTKDSTNYNNQINLNYIGVSGSTNYFNVIGQKLSIPMNDNINYIYIHKDASNSSNPIQRFIVKKHRAFKIIFDKPIPNGKLFLKIKIIYNTV